jgi:hypothetical protein
MSQFDKWLSVASNPKEGLDGRWVDLANGVPFIDGYDYFALGKVEVLPSLGLDAVVERGPAIVPGTHWAAYLWECERRREITLDELVRALDVLGQMSDPLIERAELLRQVSAPSDEGSGPVPGA